LKPQEKGLLTLYYLQEQSMEEVAEATGLTVSNAKVKIHRARKKLHQQLAQLLKSEISELL
jgi:RNA polymerase sigma-70 factor (ECF subfamily)